MLALRMAFVRQVGLVHGTSATATSNALAVRHVCAWNLTDLNARRHQTHWSICLAKAHHLVWGLRLTSVQRLPYADMRRHARGLQTDYGDHPFIRSVLRSIYADKRVVRTHLHSPYSDSALVRAGLRVDYADKVSMRSSLRLHYGLMVANRTRFAVGYALSINDPVAKRHAIAWSVLRDQAIQSVVNTPVMRWQGLTIPILQARLSCDEDSPFWIASVEVARVADFAAIAISDVITLQLGAETFALVVDGKTLSRESQTLQRLELTAISPLALLDAPFAATLRYFQPDAVAARTAVEDLIGNVDWQLLDWTIPAGRLLMEGVTPLSAARSIVAAIGGIVESHPDGTVVCRRRHPVSIPDYGKAPVAHNLFDADVLASRAQIAPARGYNRITLANEDSANGRAADRIEYVADADDANQGTLRAYLATARPVLLTHTGHPATVIANQGEVTRVESELIEFIEGHGSTHYPVTAISRATWQHTDLGVVTADGQDLLASVPGYSLLDLTYITSSLDWRVALAADETVQFILVDA